MDDTTADSTHGGCGGRQPGGLGAPIRLALALVVALGACSQEPPAAIDETIPVAVSIPPQAFLVERLGGDRVRVQVMIPPGSTPETYEPSPHQLLSLSRARLYVEVGHPDFLFESRHLGSFLARYPNLEVVDMSRGLPFRPLPVSTAEDGHGHGESDPHLWVDPGAVRTAAAHIADALIRLDPEHATLYRQNLRRLEIEIDELDGWIRETLADLPRRRFYVYHPAWGYFAARYHLEQMAIESGGKEPGTAELLDRIGQARREGVRVLFVQPGFSDRSARVLAGELGARLVTLDPLAYDWLDNLRRVTVQLHEALSDAS